MVESGVYPPRGGVRIAEKLALRRMSKIGLLLAAFGKGAPNPDLHPAAQAPRPFKAVPQAVRDPQRRCRAVLALGGSGPLKQGRRARSLPIAARGAT